MRNRLLIYAGLFTFVALVSASMSAQTPSATNPRYGNWRLKPTDPARL